MRIALSFNWEATTSPLIFEILRRNKLPAVTTTGYFWPGFELIFSRNLYLLTSRAYPASVAAAYFANYFGILYISESEARTGNKIR